MKYLASRHFTDGEKASTLFYLDGTWFILCAQDIRALPPLSDKDVFAPVSQETVIGRVPEFVRYHEEQQEIILEVDEKGNIQKSGINASANVGGDYDFSARADLEAQVEISVWKYLLARKTYLLKLLFVVAVVTGLAAVFTYSALLLLLVVGYHLVQQLENARNIHLKGELLPGVIISLQPFQVAALADLSKAYTPDYPALRIQTMKTARKGYQTGQKIPVVGGYTNIDARISYWDHWSFNTLPESLSPGMSWAKIYQVPQASWDALENLLPKIGENIVGDKTLPIVRAGNGWDQLEVPSVTFYDFRGKPTEVTLPVAAGKLKIGKPQSPSSGKSLPS